VGAFFLPWMAGQDWIILDKDQELSELLDSIVWAHRIVTTDDGLSYVFRPLAVKERNMAAYVYKQSLQQAKTKGMLERAQLKRTAIKNELWPSSGDKDMKALREELSSSLKEAEKHKEANKNRRTETAALKKINKRIAFVSEKIKELEVLHTQHIDLPSAEYYAERERAAYILHCSAMTFPDMNAVWPQYADLQTETNRNLVVELLNLYFQTELSPESKIRELARSGLWRIKWTASKKNRGVKTLFGSEMYELTMDQFRLVYWSQIYDSAFEAMEPPSDNVIENDKLFDSWLEEQSEKRKQENKKSEFEKKLNKQKGDGSEVGFSTDGFYSEECNCGVKDMKNRRGHLHAPSCSYGVFIYYGKEKAQEAAEEIQSANPDAIRKLLADEQRRMAETSIDGIEEQNLRTDKSRSAFGMNTTMHKK
jgi:hypothetical protein